MLWWACECVQNVPPHLQWVEAMRPEEAAFLQDLPFTLSVPSHRLLIVHAGLVPQRPKHRQHFLDMYQVPSLLSALGGLPVQFTILGPYLMRLEMRSYQCKNRIHAVIPAIMQLSVT